MVTNNPGETRPAFDEQPICVIGDIGTYQQQSTTTETPIGLALTPEGGHLVKEAVHCRKST